MTPRRQVFTSAFLLFFGLWDAVLVSVTITAPGFWFRFFHGTPAIDPQGLLARTGGVWAAFSLFHLLAWRLWRRRPWRLVLVGGMRLSEIFADLTWLLHASSMTANGTLAVLLATPSNIFFGVFFVRGFLQLVPGINPLPRPAPAADR